MAAPILIAYDGSGPARRAVREAAELFNSRQVLVATVWEEALAYGSTAMPMAGADFQPAPVDVGVTREVAQELETHARRVAEDGAEQARVRRARG
jgi:nucleotide-binding universal stress UspA family protein